MWDESKESMVVKLWGEGKTVSIISNAVGMSKGAVVGKVHRLNLPSRPSPIKAREKPVEKVEVTKPTVSGLDQYLTSFNKPKNEKMKMKIIKGKVCQWIEGDPKYDTMCGNPAVMRSNGKSTPWCECHFNRAYAYPDRLL